jgi:molecular chaperone GrpE
VIGATKYEVHTMNDPSSDPRQPGQTPEQPQPHASPPAADEHDDHMPDEPAAPDAEAPAQTDPALQAERDELYERLQRLSADYQNYLKRSAQNLADGVALARGDLLKQLIPVLDHFDNALAAEPASDEARSLHDGLRMVRDELLKVMHDNGVERIEPAVGETFDPERHEAMYRQPAEGVEPNHVTLAMQPGYLYGRRTLRAAKVAVAPEE